MPQLTNMQTHINNKKIILREKKKNSPHNPTQMNQYEWKNIFLYWWFVA